MKLLDETETTKNLNDKVTKQTKRRNYLNGKLGKINDCVVFPQSVCAKHEY